MKQIVMCRFITIGVFLIASSVFAVSELPTYDVTGKWYVVGLSSPPESIKYQCWTIDILPPSTETFEGVSVFKIGQGDKLHESHFHLKRLEVTPGYANDQFQIFSVEGETDYGQTINITSIELWYAEANPVAVLHEIHFAEAVHQPWEEIFISRQSSITAEMVPLANYLIDNSNCELDYETDSY